MQSDPRTQTVERRNEDCRSAGQDVPLLNEFEAAGGWLVASALTALVLSIALLAAVPPVDRDALTHHLAVPKMYLKHGGIYEIPHVPFSYYPMNLDLLYMIPLYFGNDIVPKYIHFAFALLTAGLIGSYLYRRLCSPIAALLGALLFLSLPVIVKLSITVYVDLGLIFFSTAALLQLLRWAETGFPLKRLVLSGIFAGLCLGTKPNGMLSFFFLAAAVPFLYRADAAAPSAQPSDDPRSHLQNKSSFGALGWSAVFAMITLLVYSPWMLRNYIWTGNPVYPMAQAIFAHNGPADTSAPANDTTEAGASQSPDNREKGDSGSGHFAGRKVIFGESLLEILAIPLRVFFQGQDDNPRLFDGRLNPYLLVFPLIAVRRANGRKRPPRIRLEIRLLGAFSLLYLLFAFFLVDMRIRYIAPIIPPLVILAVIGIQDLVGIITARLSLRPQPMALSAAGVIFLGLLGLNAAYLVDQFRIVDPISYLRGEVSREAYILKHRPEYAVIQHANQHLPINARILVLFNGNRIYYIEREAISSSELFRSLVKKGQSSEVVRDELSRKGISHLLVGIELFNWWATAQFNDHEKQILNVLFQDHFKRLYQSHGYILFQVMSGV